MTTYRSGRLRLAHVAVVAAGWVVFCWLWWQVLDRPGALHEVRSMLLLLAVVVVMVALLTWVWITHNVALARRRGGRRAATGPLVRPSTDLLGRRLDLAPDVANASVVVVVVDGSVKRFRTEERTGA